jgi:hypothetical protein
MPVRNLRPESRFTIHPHYTERLLKWDKRGLYVT